MREAEAGGTNGNLPVLVFDENSKNFGKYQRVTCIGRKALVMREAEAGGTNGNLPVLMSHAGPKTIVSINE